MRLTAETLRYKHHIFFHYINVNSLFRSPVFYVDCCSDSHWDRRILAVENTRVRITWSWYDLKAPCLDYVIGAHNYFLPLQWTAVPWSQMKCKIVLLLKNTESCAIQTVLPTDVNLSLLLSATSHVHTYPPLVNKVAIAWFFPNKSF